MTQVDQLAGVRSTSSTLSVICLNLTHGGRAGTISLVSTLDMLDVAAVTSSPAARDELLVSIHRTTGSSQEGGFVGQLISAAVVDSETSSVAVLMHCGTMTRTFVAQVDSDSEDVKVMSTVLSMESSLEVCHLELKPKAELFDRTGLDNASSEFMLPWSGSYCN